MNRENQAALYSLRTNDIKFLKKIATTVYRLIYFTTIVIPC